MRRKTSGLDAPIASSEEQWRARGWTDAAEGMAGFKAVLRVQRSYENLSNQVLRPFELNITRYEVLLYLLFREGCTTSLGRLSHSQQLSPAAVTYVVDRLEAAGLVLRSTSQGDRRVTMATLTDAGRLRVVEATGVMNERIFTSTGLSSDELGDLIALTTQLTKRLLDHADPRSAESAPNESAAGTQVR